MRTFWLTASTARDFTLLALATLACLLPFLGKAFHVDDTLFLWTAGQIQAQPWDFFGFRVNWEGSPAWMHQVTMNPPLAAYYLALAAALAGWSEYALHGAFLLPAVLAVWGTYAVARELCARPLEAALLLLALPFFTLSASALMCDVPLLACWVWAVALWMRGLERAERVSLAGAGFLAACALWTKYFGACLIPLMLAYGWCARGKLGAWALWLLLPAAALAAYEGACQALYGHSLLGGAIEYAVEIQNLPRGRGWVRVLTAVFFTGGGAAAVAFYAPLLWTARRRWTALALAAVLLAYLYLAQSLGPLRLSFLGRLRWDLALHLLFFLGAGLAVLALPAEELAGAFGRAGQEAPGADVTRRRARAGALLLALWLWGTFVFAAFCNWTVNGRTLLPLLPAAAILTARWLERRPQAFARLGFYKRALPLLAGVGLSLAVTAGDCRWAEEARAAPLALHARYARPGRTFWFQGHWGTQYYLEERGARALDYTSSALAEGDVVLVPRNNYDIQPLPAACALVEVVAGAPRWAHTNSTPLGAGYYACIFGPFPYVLGWVAPDRYEVYLVARPVRYPLGP